MYYLTFLANINYVSVLLPLALVLITSKALAILCKKVGLPQLLGYIVCGLLLGLIQLIPNQTIFSTESDAGLGFLAKIGVIFIMFSAGMGTDIKQIKQTGIKSILITLAGVILPMGLGFIATVLFNGGFENIANNYVESLAYGCILTATSVSVTVATLKELGKLKSPMGTCVVSAAILDDIIGVVALSIVLGFEGNNAASEVEQAFLVEKLANAGMNASLASLLCIFSYFVIFIGIGLLLSKELGDLARKYDHHRRIPVFSIALAFIYAYLAEEIFGVADITGAFLAGLLLSTNHDRDYIDSKTDTFSGLIFTPVFFANIGINISFGKIDPNFILFGIVFVICGIVGKLFGCGLVAKLCKFSWKDSASIGIGMMVRAEVALVCTDKLKAVTNNQITTFVVILILITSLITPVVLKSLNKEKIVETEVAK